MKHARHGRRHRRGGGSILPDRVLSEWNVPFKTRADKLNQSLKTAWGAVTSSVSSILQKPVVVGGGGRRKRAHRKHKRRSSKK